MIRNENTSYPSECVGDESSPTALSKRPTSNSQTSIIKTIDLLALNQFLRAPAGMAQSFDGTYSLGESDIRQSIEYGSNQAGDELSYLQRGVIAIPSPDRQAGFLDHPSKSPQPDTFPLAPDAQGNKIPPDAKWTKINRRLVSPEVLEKDRRRYEA
jgi:hypothetical protein